MAISDNYVPIRQIGNGVTTQFSSNWNMVAAAYALVYLEDAVTGVQTAVPPGPGAGQYTLVFSASGFTVTYGTAPTAAQYAVVGRSVTLDQVDPYRTSKGYQGEVLESSLDKITAMIQDLSDKADRSLKFQLGSTAIGILPTPVDDAVLAWSGTTGLIKNGPTTGVISGAAAAAAAAIAAAAQAIAAATNSPVYNCPTVGGTANAITLTTSSVVTSFINGQIFEFLPTANNTLATTAFINGIGVPAAIVDITGAPLTTGAIVNAVPTMIMRYGSTFYLLKDGREMLTSAVQAITAAKTFAASTLYANDINGGQIAGFRNGLINGAADVWQRGTSFTPSVGVVTYTADRWCVLRSTNANYTVSRQTGPDGSNYCIRVQRNVGTSNVDNILLANSFESIDSVRYRGKKVMLRFKARAGANYSNAGGTLLSSVNYGTGTDQNGITGYTGAVGASSQAVVLTTSWQTFTITSGSAVALNCNEIGPIFSFTPVGTAGAADYYEISEVEILDCDGGVDTYFERLNFSTVLNQCMRYFEKTFPYATAPADNAGVNGAQSVAQMVAASTGITGFGSTMMVPKRIAPAITTYNPSGGTSGQVYNANTATTCSAIAIGSIGDSHFTIGFTTVAGSAVGNMNCLHWAANAEL